MLPLALLVVSLSPAKASAAPPSPPPPPLPDWPCLHPAPAHPVPPPTNVTATCDDPADCTKGLQAALDTGARQVVVPKLTQDWIVRPICLRSNQTVLFQPGVVVAAKPGAFLGERDGLLNARETTDTKLIGYGATLLMRKTDYMNTSNYNHSEGRSAIWFWAVTRGSIHGLSIGSSGGDGISIMRQELSGYPIGWCVDIHVKDVHCFDNYRQGMSIMSVDGLLVENSRFDSTWGTSPAAGIDIEPDHPTGFRLHNITIRNCSASGNQGGGLLITTAMLNASSYPVSIDIDGFEIDGDGGAPHADGGGVTLTQHLYYPAVAGSVRLNNLRVRNTKLCGLCLFSWAVKGVPISLSNSVLENVALNASAIWARGSSPVLIYPYASDATWHMRQKSPVPPVGGISMSNLTIFERTPTLQRPWLSFSNVNLGPGFQTLVHNVSASAVEVYASPAAPGKPPAACGADVGAEPAARGVTLGVSCNPLSHGGRGGVVRCEAAADCTDALSAALAQADASDVVLPNLGYPLLTRPLSFARGAKNATLWLASGTTLAPLPTDDSVDAALLSLTETSDVFIRGGGHGASLALGGAILHGIRLLGCKGGGVRDLKIDGAGGHGIVVDASEDGAPPSGVIIDSVNVSASGGAGAFVGGAVDVTVSGARLTLNRGGGALVRPAAANATVYVSFVATVASGNQGDQYAAELGALGAAASIAILFDGCTAVGGAVGFALRGDSFPNPSPPAYSLVNIRGCVADGAARAGIELVGQAASAAQVMIEGCRVVNTGDAAGAAPLRLRGAGGEGREAKAAAARAAQSPYGGVSFRGVRIEDTLARPFLLGPPDGVAASDLSGCFLVSNPTAKAPTDAGCSATVPAAAAAGTRLEVTCNDKPGDVQGSKGLPPTTGADGSSVVFSSCEGAIACYRIPLMLDTTAQPGGDAGGHALVAIAEARHWTCNDFGPKSIAVKRSLDGGATWGPLLLLQTDTGGDQTRPGLNLGSAVYDDTSHTIFIHFLSNNSLGDSLCNSGYIASTDGGLTWGGRVDYSHVTRAAGVDCYNAGPGTGLQMRGSAMRGPGRLLQGGKGGGPASFGGRLVIPGEVFLLSDDHGASWRAGDHLPIDAEKGVSPSEVMAVQLSNGSLLLNMRTHGLGKRALAVSRDGGESWGPYVLAADLPDPNCEGSTVALRDGRLAFANPVSNLSGVRSHVGLHVSADDGRSWMLRRILWNPPSAYTSAVELAADGDVGVLFEARDEAPAHYEWNSAYQRIRFMRAEV